MSERSHAEVLSAAANGNDEALASLVHAYHDRVYRFGLRVCRDGFDADDAVQEAFTKLAQRPDVAASEGTLFWLLAVVKHACFRLFRPFARERRHLGERLDVDAVGSTEELNPRPRSSAGSSFAQCTPASRSSSVPIERCSCYATSKACPASRPVARSGSSSP